MAGVGAGFARGIGRRFERAVVAAIAIDGIFDFAGTRLDDAGAARTPDTQQGQGKRVPDMATWQSHSTSTSVRMVSIQLEGDVLGTPSQVVCPICQGNLTEVEVDGFPHFRCHVGHAFSLRSMAEEQADAVESALWAASRALEESAALAKRMAKSATGDMEQRFLERHDAQLQQARLIRQIILGVNLPSPRDSQALRPAS